MRATGAKLRMLASDAAKARPCRRDECGRDCDDDESDEREDDSDGDGDGERIADEGRNNWTRLAHDDGR